MAKQKSSCWLAQACNADEKCFHWNFKLLRLMSQYIPKPLLGGAASRSQFATVVRRAAGSFLATFVWLVGFVSAAKCSTARGSLDKSINVLLSICRPRDTLVAVSLSS